MTNAELIAKIKAEIERLKDENNNIRCDSNKAYCQGYGDAFVDLLPFLNTLEPEKPSDLGERICSYDIVPYIDDKIAALQDMWREEKVAFDWDDLKDMIEDVARHFAQWGAEHLADVRKMIEPEKMEREEELKKAVHQVSEEIVKEIFPDDLESGDFFTEIDLKNCITRVAYQFADWGADHAPLPEDTDLFNKGVEEGRRLERDDIPKWYKVKRGSCFDKHTDFLLSAREGHFYCSSMEVPRDGYILLVNELERLPKEDVE